MRQSVAFAVLSLSLLLLPTISAHADTLQDWFDSHGYGINAATDELGIETFGPGLCEATVLNGVHAYLNLTGWYLDSGERHLLFGGVPEVGATDSFIADEEFGFYIDTGSDFFHTETALNMDGVDHAVVYANPGGPGYIIAFEDMLGGGDMDYTDRVILVTPTAYGPWYVDCTVPVSGDGRSWPTAFKTVQEGLDAAGEGDEIIVAPGTYPETIQFQGRNVILHSTDPNDPKIVASTIIINGGAQASVVTFTGIETPECILFGFTILNGNGEYGGGICGGSEEKHTKATIRNNTITQNQAIHDGGGIAFCDGLIENNVISENAAAENGGGLHDCQGTIRNNDILGNSASHSGGGVHRCDGPIEDNTITDNQAGQDGGGLCDCQGDIRNNTITNNNAVYSGGGMYLCHGPIANNTISGNTAARGGGLDECSGTIENNLITDNSASYGGGGLAWCEGTVQHNIIRGNLAFYGGGLAWGQGTIRSNLIVGNQAQDRGGGMERCEGFIRNNTIVRNTASDRGGGLADSPGSILNCIIWANTAQHFPQLSDSSDPTYCCIEGCNGGQGNISVDPAFVDADGPDDNPDTYEDNDYHPKAASSCIDAGWNETWMWNALDLDGHLRIHFGAFSLTVDMGAYEHASSIFRVVELTRTASGAIELAWTSGLEESYSVLACYDLARGSWIRVNRDPIPSAGQITTWTVPAGAYPCMFYRIQIL